MGGAGNTGKKKKKSLFCFLQYFCKRLKIKLKEWASELVVNGKTRRLERGSFCSKLKVVGA